MNKEDYVALENSNTLATEALHSIDVNSGSKQARSSNQEENALATNLDACLQPLFY